MEKQNEMLDAIRKLAPGLALRTIERIGSGQNNEVWLVDSAFIFRFPRYEEGVRQLRREADLLERIAGRLPLAIPRPEYGVLEPAARRDPAAAPRAESAAAGRAFMGYRKIEGVPLEGERLHRMRDDASLRRVAGQLTGFLKALHATDLAVGAGWLELEAGSFVPYREWEELYERLRLELYRFMNPEARDRTDRHFADFFAARGHSRIDAALIHGDFGGSNILCDPSENKLTGVIDFGSAHVGDPATDYAALSASYGDEFLRIAAELNPDILGMRDRILFYKGTFALQEALFGLEHGDDEAFKSGLATVNGRTAGLS